MDSGVDSADFSHGLCEQMAQRASDISNWSNPPDLQAVDLIEAGYFGLVHDSTVAAGGSTACVAVARRDGRLNLAKWVAPTRDAHPRTDPPADRPF